VNNNCTINTGTGLSFGSYSGSDATATGTVTTTCTIGASATITLDQGANAGPGSTDAAPLRRLSDGGTNNLSYELFQDADRTTDWGNTAGTGVGIVGDGGPKDTTVYGKIPGGQNVPAGPYEDSVTATVTF
jgi:spore coat protein U-like protein